MPTYQKARIEIAGTCCGWAYAEGGAQNDRPGSKIAAEREAARLAIIFAAAPETAAERDRLKAINAELLEALGTIASFARGNGHVCEIIARRAAAAIAKATAADT